MGDYTESVELYIVLVLHELLLSSVCHVVSQIWGFQLQTFISPVKGKNRTRHSLTTTIRRR